MLSFSYEFETTTMDALLSWWKFLSPMVGLFDYSRDESRNWVKVSDLSDFKKYTISNIILFDRVRNEPVGNEDPFFEMVSLRHGEVYTKRQLEKELETLDNCGMFEVVDIHVIRTNPNNNTMAVCISFVESTWQPADKLRCINVGLMERRKYVKMEDLTEEGKEMEEYDRRIEQSRPCLLPETVYREAVQMLKAEGKVSTRTLQKIRDKVQKWYHDEGYICAQVVNFGDLNTGEVVCEVVEGDITQLVIQFQDKFGNVVEKKTTPDVVMRKLQLPDQLKPGHVYNIEVGKQAVKNLISLALFSSVELKPKPDDKGEGGIIVEIKLQELELEQKTAGVSTEVSEGGNVVEVKQAARIGTEDG